MSLRTQYTVTDVKTAAFTAQLGMAVRADTTGGGFTLTLPDLVLEDVGIPLPVINSGTANTLTIDGDGADTIDSSATMSLPAGTTVILVPTSISTWESVTSPAGSATETAEGLIELATQAEVDAGTDATRAVTPATLAAATSVGVRDGLAQAYTDGIDGHGLLAKVTTYGTEAATFHPADVKYRCRKFTSDGTSGFLCGWASGVDFTAATLPKVRIVMGWGLAFGSNNERIFVGISEIATTHANMVDADDPDATHGLKYIGIHALPGDTNLFWARADGDMSGHTRSDTGVAKPGTSVIYAMEFIWNSAASITCRLLDDAGVELDSQTFTTDLPNGALAAMVLIQTTDATTEEILFNKAWVRANNDV